MELDINSSKKTKKNFNLAIKKTMKYLAATFLLIHAVIHLIGFLKGFNLAEVESIKTFISKNQAILWLSCAVLFSLAAILYLLENKGILIVLPLATIISMILIFTTWSDSKFGLIPNLIFIILIISIYSSNKMNKMIENEKTAISKVSKSDLKIHKEEELENLPAAIQKWLKNSGIIGKKEIKTVWVSQKAKMKMKPEQENWHYAEAEQWVNLENPAFIWVVKMKMFGFLNIKGRDKFKDGQGEMLIKLGSLLNIVNEKGPKIDEGSLQRFLGELVWYPSFALSEFIEWQEIDSLTAKAEMKYKESSGSGYFYFNEKGDFVKFSTLRFMGNKADDKKNEWLIEVDEYAVFDGIKVPSKMRATWKLETQDWTWLKLEIEDIKYN